MNSSKAAGQALLSIRALLIITTVLLALGLVLARSLAVLEDVYWLADEVKIRPLEGAWLDARVTDVSGTGELTELAAEVQILNDTLPDIPIGILLSGPFSAEIYWDEELVGEKGIVERDGKSGSPGPIDSITFLPSNRLSPGIHQIRLLISTEHLNYVAPRIIHMLAIGPYRSDDRRPLRYYVTPIILLGGLVLLMFQNARIARSAGSRVHGVLSVFAFFVVVNLLAEISRAVVNYPYNLHLFRGTVMWVSAIGAGASLVFLTADLRRLWWVRLILLICAVGFVVSQLSDISGDRQIVHDFMILSAAPALVFMIYSLKQGISFRLILPLFWVASLVSQFISYGMFLDIYFYIATMIFLAGSWYATYAGSILPANQSEAISDAYRFALKNAGREYYVVSEKVVVLRAASNYTELIDTSGKVHLHAKRLGDLMQEVPDDFMRVHRSVGVNMAYVKELKSMEGSRYQLILNDDQTVPVSRYRVTDIRERMKLGQGLS